MPSPILIFLKGILMGAADIVPGVSGGTVAVIVGIYSRFIDTLSKLVSRDSLNLLKQFKIKDYFFYINGLFIVPLAGGIFFSIFVFSHIILFLYENYNIVLWAFFFGLILSSVVFLLKMIHKLSIDKILIFAFGTALAYFLVSLNFGETNSNEVSYLMVFVSGLIALSAMMLPGISGSFLLVILGQYPVILRAVKELDFVIIILFATGGGLSLLFFSKFINWLLEKHFQISLALLSGFLLGSIKTIWPWKIMKNQIEVNVLPNTYLESGKDSYFIMAIIFFLLGVMLVSSVEVYKNKMSKTNNEKVEDNFKI